MFLPAELDFGLNMIRFAFANEPLVVSPVSMIFALAMIRLGAKGPTRSQINSVISKEASDDDIDGYYPSLFSHLQNASGGVKTHIANGFFLDKNFYVEKEYERKIRKDYNARVQALDFRMKERAAKVINDFVSGQTKGKIRDIVKTDSIQGAYSLVLNAIYFHADWHERFYKGFNTKKMFYRQEGEGREMEFMQAFNVYRLYAEDDEIEVLSLQYADTSYAFNIFLPKTRFDFSNMRWNLTAKRIEDLLSKLDQTYMTILIPKMKIETNLKLKEILPPMGISNIFNYNADLSGIVQRPQLQISEVTHDAIIEVDEDGTTAAAATKFKAEWKSLKVSVPIEFRADHPFIFILTKDKNPLFMGQFL
uniref:SERPIN domain-containing protein n=1 Tax=Haemonchus contortus TaxID=6289 RepID=A0A7I5EDN9_HAECO